MHVLLVEDLPSDAELNEREVRRVLPGSVFLRVEDREAYLSALKSFKPDLILSDYMLPAFNGSAALALAVELAPETPFIIVTGSTNEDTAVECMKAGAWDYIIKEHVKRLGTAVEAALEQKRLREERKRALEELRLKDAAIAHSTNPIVITTSDGVLCYVNAAWERLHGYESKDVLGRRAFELWPEVATSLRETLGQAESGVFEREMHGKDGVALVVQVSVSRVRNNAGQPIGLLISEVDISERKRSEEKLREQLDELHRWQDVMLDREDRVAVLKREVNVLCRRMGDPPRYPGQQEVDDGASIADRRMTGDDRPAIRPEVTGGKVRAE